LTAPNGVVGLETSLAATLTALYHTGLASIPQIIGWMAEKPRDILGLAVPQIRVGASADLILVDLNEEWTVDPDKLHSKSKNTVFKGMRLRGKVKYTITDGQIRFADSTSF
ncbi:MAG: dihydroorotase, partial [Ruminococcus sp.]|nr:dihydroorotase [Ruminococcus sp.]